MVVPLQRQFSFVLTAKVKKEPNGRFSKVLFCFLLFQRSYAVLYLQSC